MPPHDVEQCSSQEDRLSSCDVHKPLLSITCSADMGFDCYRGQFGGHLEDTNTGERIPLHRKDNLYTMRTWVRKEPDNPLHLGRQA